MANKSVLFALGLSVSAHAYCAAYFWSAAGKTPAPVQEAVFLSLVRSEPVPAAPTPKPLQYPEFKKSAKPATLKKAAEPMKAQAHAQVPVPTASVPAPTQKIPRPAAAPGSRSAEVMEREKEAVYAGKELLRDPQKGKVFSEYFGQVRAKIDRTVRKEYSKHGTGEGSVTLLFILSADGRLDKASVVDAQTRSEEQLRLFAIQCLRRAAPFEPFPSQLEARRIAFNVTVLFEEL